eukprot:g16783.t1
MSFLLNYLDGALDTVTGRYDGEEGDESLSEGGSLVADVADTDDVEGGSSGESLSATTATAAAAAAANAASKQPEPPPAVPGRLGPIPTGADQNSRGSNDSPAAASPASGGASSPAATRPVSSNPRADFPPRQPPLPPPAPARTRVGVGEGLVDTKAREALLPGQRNQTSSPARSKGSVASASESLVMQPPHESTARVATRRGSAQAGAEGREEGRRGNERWGRREETLQLDELALEPGAAERQQVLLDEEKQGLAAAAAAAAAAAEEEKERERLRQLELEERERDRQRALDLERRRQEEEVERRLAAEAAAEAMAAAAAAAAVEEERQRELERRREEEEEEQQQRLAQAAAVAAELKEEQQRRERLLQQQQEEDRLAAEAAAAAAARAAAGAEEERASRERARHLQMQIGARQEAADEASLAAERDREAQQARRLAAAAEAEAERQRQGRREGPPPGTGNDKLAPQPLTPVRGERGEGPAFLSPPGRRAVKPAVTTATALAVSAGSSSSSRDSAREEAWAAARMLAEENARAQAVREAALRAEDKHEDGGAAAAGAGGGAATSTAAPSGVAGGERDSWSSRPEHVALDAVVESGEPGAVARRAEAEIVAEPDGLGGGWRGFFSGRRHDAAWGGSATSSVSGSQVSTAVDPALSILAEAPGGTPSASSSSRPWGSHDFQRVRKPRRPRGVNGGAASDPSSPPLECAACLGLWDSGGSALNRWYRCRHCGGTVHGACRQFFEAGEACVEPGGGGGGVQGEEGALARPVGWRDPVNRAGVVQVGVLQAFDLSLKPGESVYVALRLLPWKERVKTGSAKWGDLGASWPSHTSARHDLLHLYNSDATPVPTLRVEVWRSAMRVLDDLLGGGSTSGGGLGANGDGGGGDKHSTLLPEVPELDDVEESDSGGGGDIQMGNSGTGYHEAREEEAVVVPEEEEADEEGMAHLFRVKSYPAPVWCEVCDRLLLGMRNQGFCCEACGMNVHRGCQLRANFSKSCPGQGNKKAGRGTQNGGVQAKGRNNSREVDEGVGLIQIHLRSAHRCGMRCHGGHHSYLADATDPHAESGVFAGSGSYSAAALATTAAAAAATPVDPSRGTAGNSEHIFSPGRRRRRGGGGGRDDSGFIRGDHYCRVRVGRRGGPSELAEEVRTEAVFQTPDPVFERTWVFIAPSYDAVVTIDLVDASTDRPVGRFETTVIALLQADYDAHAVGRTPPSQGHRDIRLVPPTAEEDEDNVTGLLKARVEFDENTEAFFGPNGILGPQGGNMVRSVPRRQKADLGVETLKLLMARIKAVFLWLKVAKDCYARVMSWENPALSSFSLLVFVYLTLVANAEYLLALLPFSLLLFMTWGFLSRRSGGYVQGWVSAESAGAASSANDAGFRPVGTLKVAVVRGRGLVSSDLNLPGNAYVRVSYIVPDSNATAEADRRGTGNHPQDPSTLKEYLVGQTVPQPTGDNPEWGSVGGNGGGGSGGGGGGGAERASSVSMMDQSRGPGFLSGGSDALLQNMMDVWSRHASSGKAKPYAADSADRPEDRLSKQPPTPSAPSQEEDMCFVYPVLQPRIRRRVGSGGLPWSGEESRTFLRFSVYFANPFNSLMDAFQGHVVVPLSALASNEMEGGAQPEVRGWFDVSPAEESFPSMAPPSPSHSAPDRGSEAAGDRSAKVDHCRGQRVGVRTGSTPSNGLGEHADGEANHGDNEGVTGGGGGGGGGGVGSMGAIFLRLQLTLPGSDVVITDEEREASRALQALLGENSHRGEGDKGAGAGAASSGPAGAGAGGGGDNGGAGREVDGGGGAVARLLGMPMGFRNTIREVQDTIGTVLDTVEAVKNLLNWTHPPKTLMVYALVALVWIVLLVVPGRYIVLTLGLLEFSKAWLGAKEPGADELVPDHAAAAHPPPPLATKLKNLLMSLPVDSELAMCYAWEAREYSKKAKASLKLREQRARLKLLGAGRQWEGALRVRDRVGDPWESRYVVLLGHRLAWWGSANELDDGRKARGQLLLQGHAGVTHLSPLEAREVSDPRKVVCVFGRSPDGLPHKVTFMSDSVAEKEALESAVYSVVETKRD